ncbi:uncharacterized protein [Apostichopus japonicus]
MLEGKEVYMLNPNNDISYYAVKCPSPLKNRDFIMQRTWLVTPTEYVIFNHSIYHSEFPPRKGLIRGESMLTGYLMRPKGKTSCELTYVTQMDPKGTVPMWAVNKVAEYLAPSILKNLHKACQRYPAWKSVNNPHYKPWLYPEQMNLPRLNLSHILSKSFSSEESLEDGDLKEEDFKGDRPASSIPKTPEKAKQNGHIGEPKEQTVVSPPLRQTQSETSLMQPSSSSTTPASSTQTSPSRQQYSQHNQRSDIKITKRQSKPHHGSSPAIYSQNQGHQMHRQQQQQNSSSSLGRAEQMQNGYSPSPHSSPMGYVRKKFAKWTGSSRHISDNSDDLRNMDYQQLQKEIMIREHEARMLAFQEDLDMKRREHQVRMDLLDAVSRGGSKVSSSDIQQVLLHRTSSIVTNEMILGKADAKKDVNGYRNRGKHEVRALESSTNT